MAIVWHAYANDHDGFFPERDCNRPPDISTPQFDTRPLIESYVTALEMFYCPSTEATPDSPSRWRSGGSGAGNFLIDYTIMPVWKRSGAVGVNYVGPEAAMIYRAEEARPHLVMFTDQAWGNPGTGSLWFNHPESSASLGFLTQREWQGLNIVKYDGSNRWRDAKETQLQAFRGAINAYY